MKLKRTHLPSSPLLLLTSYGSPSQLVRNSPTFPSVQRLSWEPETLVLAAAYTKHGAENDNTVSWRRSSGVPEVGFCSLSLVPWNRNGWSLVPPTDNFGSLWYLCS